MLCSGFKEDVEPACSKGIYDTSNSIFQWLNEILIGLADCVAFYGSATAEVISSFQKLTMVKLQNVELVLTYHIGIYLSNYSIKLFSSFDLIVGPMFVHLAACRLDLSR